MELADRIEQLDGPDREIDWDIFCLVQPDRLPFYEEKLAEVRAEAEKNGIWAIRADAVIQGQRDLVCPRYTASVDAALTLVPEGWSHGFNWNNLHQNAQAHCELIPKAPFRPEELLIASSGKCNSPALAICAAALRAKSA